MLAPVDTRGRKIEDIYADAMRGSQRIPVPHDEMRRYPVEDRSPLPYPAEAYTGGHYRGAAPSHSSFAARGARDTIEVDRHPATHNASPPRPDDLVYAEGDRYQNNYKPGYNDSKQPYQYNRPAGGPSSYSYNNNDNYPSKRQPRSTPHAAIGNELAQTQSELLHVLRESAYNANNRAPRAPYQETKPYPAIDAPRYQPMQHYPPSGDEAYLNQRVTEPVWHGQRYPPITRWVVQDDQDTRRDKMWAPPGMNNFANLEALPLASAPEGAGGPAALQPEDLERARDVIRELFALHGLTGPKYEGLMEPWLRDANVIESIARLCTAWVPMTRYGLREGSPPIEQWFTIVSFVNNKGGGRFPCLTWFDDPDSKKYRDHCPLNELVSFKAGTTCATSPGFTPYRDETGSLRSATPAKAEPSGHTTNVVVRPEGCMVIAFKERVLETHCNQKADSGTVSIAMTAVVGINQEAIRQAAASSVDKQFGHPEPEFKEAPPTGVI